MNDKATFSVTSAADPCLSRPFLVKLDSLSLSLSPPSGDESQNILNPHSPCWALLWISHRGRVSSSLVSLSQDGVVLHGHHIYFMLYCSSCFHSVLRGVPAQNVRLRFEKAPRTTVSSGRWPQKPTCKKKNTTWQKVNFCPPVVLTGTGWRFPFLNWNILLVLTLFCFLFTCGLFPQETKRAYSSHQYAVFYEYISSYLVVQ